MKWWRIAWLVGVLWCGLGLVIAQDSVTSELLNQVNRARNQAGIPALVWNSALASAAQRHSDDMATTGVLTHTGSDGSEFWMRAGDAGYAMTSGAENVLERFDTSASGAFEQWRNSAAHNANMMNAQYLEVGVAYSVASSGRVFFTMVLGARPGISAPPLFAASATPLVVPSHTPAPAIVPPSATPIPPLPTSRPVVLAASATPNAPIVLAASPTPRLALATASPVAAAPRDPLALTLVAPLPTNTPAPIIPTRVGALAPTQPAQLVSPTPSVADIRLVYDAQSLTLINVASRPLYLNDLVFISANARLEVTRWESDFLTRPLSEFPAGGCLQAWTMEVPSALAAPSECARRHAWVAVNDLAQVWRDGDRFTVWKGERALGNCLTSLGRCDLRLDGDAEPVFGGVSAPTNTSASVASTSAPSDANTTTTTTAGVVRLYLTGDSMALVNLTGAAVNLSGWSFEGDGGLFAAARWDNGNLSQPLTALPNGDCVQVWGVNTTLLPKPSECRFRHAWVAVSLEQQFWVGTTFRVMAGGQQLATCEARTASCDVRLP